MKDLLLIAKVSRRMGRIGVIANRVRENTVAYRRLMSFLNSLSISVVGVLKDSQNYVHSAEQGVSIHEMQASRVRKDADGWQPIFDWLEEKLETPLTPRDFRPIDIPVEPQRYSLVADKSKPMI